jgi:hypothetical protein
LKQEVEARRRAEAGDGRDVERERDRLGDRRQLPAIRRMMPYTCSDSSWRSSHGLRRTNTLPKFGWYVLVTAPYPPIVWNDSTPSTLLSISSTLRSTALVRSSEAPGKLHVDAEQALILVGE